MLAHHDLRLSDKVRLCELSIDYACESEDVNTLVSAFIELALAYEYTKTPEKRLKTLQRALDYSRQASPLIQSLTYSEYAAALAESKRVREAQLYIGLAEEIFPDDPAKDPGCTFVDGNIFCFSYRAGIVHLHSGSIPQAFSAFEHYKQHRSGRIIPERLRLLIANGQSRAALLANDAERYADLLEDVIVGSMRIGSQKRFDEALTLFRQGVPTSWLSFPRMKHLSEQYELRREA
jgi:tetratricopeptide (TPR) repeat protein